MLIGIEGFFGDGKTAYLVRCLKIDADNNRKIISNLKLNKIPSKIFDVEEFLNDDNNDNLRNATIGLDEITTVMDCRLSGSKSNLAFGYLVLQSRKRDVDIYYTTQDFDLVDYRRLIKYTSIFVIAQRIYKKLELENGKYILEEIDNWRNYTVVDERKRKENVISFNLKISDYYDYYDTDQIIKPINLFKNKDFKKDIFLLKKRVIDLEILLNENGIKYVK